MLKETIAKKDGEIDRLQTMRTISNEIVAGVEKAKSRTSSDHFPKPPPIDVKQQNLRRQMSVVREHKEVSTFYCTDTHLSFLLGRHTICMI